MNNNICNNCGTENEAEYIYCKNCGHQLLSSKPDKDEFPKSNTARNNTNFEFTQNNPEFVAESIDGVSKDEIALFVGKKADKYLPKFSKMEITGSKITWNWPLAILGYIFGPFGSALWFFYRKMFKPAFILTAIGAALALLTSAMLIGVDQNIVTSIYKEFSAGNISAVVELYNQLGTFNIVMIMLAGFINSIAKLAFGIVLALFGNGIYKRHCIGKILNYRAIQADQRYYQLGLTSLGGVSGGMLSLGIIIWYVFTNASELIFSVVKFLIK